MKDKILNWRQAEAVYSAMCALNNVNGSISVLIEGIRVEETHSGHIQVWSILDLNTIETYNSQYEFAFAYGV